MAVSVSTPIGYVVLLIIAFVVFSKSYRKSQIASLTSLTPWYESNIPKDIYFSLKELSTTQKIPDKLLKAALLKWAAEDIHRLLKMRDGKPILTSLHQKGSVGDVVWKRFTTFEKLLMLDLNELGREADSLKPGWSQQVIPIASEMAQNKVLRQRIAEFRADTEYQETYDRLYPTKK